MSVTGPRNDGLLFWPGFLFFSALLPVDDGGKRAAKSGGKRGVRARKEKKNENKPAVDLNKLEYVDESMDECVMRGEG